MRLLEAPYRTPDGYRDFPFAYVFNAGPNGANLTNGQSYKDIQNQLQGDSQFILRRIVGVTNCVASPASGGRWNYKGHNRQYAAGNQSTGIVPFSNWVVVPEKEFDYNEALWIDLYDVNLATNTCGGTPIPISQIAFMGVKRFNLSTASARETPTPYRYKELPQRFEYSLTINWAAFSSGTTVNPPRRFSQQMDNYDFELLRVSIGQQGSASTLTTQDFALTLYDPHSHQLSSGPLLQGYINAGKPSPSGQPAYQSLFPVPSVVYPAGSAITFDVTSLLCGTSVPQTYDISFEGIWRLPC